MNGIAIAVQSQYVDAQAQADAIHQTVIDDRVMPGQYL